MMRTVYGLNNHGFHCFTTMAKAGTNMKWSGKDRTGNNTWNVYSLDGCVINVPTLVILEDGEIITERSMKTDPENKHMKGEDLESLADYIDLNVPAHARTLRKFISDHYS